MNACRMLVCVVVGLSAVPGWADDAALEGAGGALAPVTGHPSVRMVEEEVRIKLPECRVEARFVFHNEGPATTVLVGFPEEGRAFDRSSKSQLDGFRSWVDGKSVRTRWVYTKRPTDETDHEYKGWFVKRVPFEKGQKRTVVNRYRGGFLFTTYGVNGFNYVLKTGRSWKGPIGHARIVCDISGLGNWAPVRFSPRDCKRKGTQVVWEFSNFEPRQDIWVKWFCGFGLVRINGEPAMGMDSADHIPTWGSASLPPRRIGNDVWLPVRPLERWLQAVIPVSGDYRRVRLVRDDRWAEVRVGSSSMATDRGNIILPGKIKIQSEVTDVMVVPLRPVVKALGGSTKWDKHGWLDIALPPRKDPQADR